MGINYKRFEDELDVFCENVAMQEWYMRQASIIYYLMQQLDYLSPIANSAKARALGIKKDYASVGGYFRGNWSIVLEGENKYDAAGSRMKPPRPMANSDIWALIGPRSKGMLPKWQDFASRDRFKFIKIYNPVWYDEFLEHGTSRQAPNGVITVALKNTMSFMYAKGYR